MIVTDTHPVSEMYISDVARLLRPGKDAIIAHTMCRITEARREVARLAVANTQWNAQ